MTPGSKWMSAQRISIFLVSPSLYRFSHHFCSCCHFDRPWHRHVQESVTLRPHHPPFLFSEKANSIQRRYRFHPFHPLDANLYPEAWVVGPPGGEGRCPVWWWYFSVGKVWNQMRQSRWAHLGPFLAVKMARLTIEANNAKSTNCLDCRLSIKISAASAGAIITDGFPFDIKCLVRTSRIPTTA